MSKTNGSKSFFKTYGFLIFMISGIVAGCLVGAFAPDFGGKPLHGAVIDSKKDHRIAMTFAVAALGASGETEILDADCVNISYPGFYGDLERLCK